MIHKQAPTLANPQSSSKKLSQHLISTLANFKANGLDSIMNESIKYGGASMAHTLHTLFDFMWRSELSPAIWAKAYVSLLSKGGDKDPLPPQAYRPIPLTSTVSKIYESILLARAIKQSDATNTLPEEQGGFRKQRSCLDQNFILQELINSRSTRNINTYTCFADFENAFPCIKNLSGNSGPFALPPGFERPRVRHPRILRSDWPAQH